MQSIEVAVDCQCVCVCELATYLMTGEIYSLRSGALYWLRIVIYCDFPLDYHVLFPITYLAVHTIHNNLDALYSSMTNVLTGFRYNNFRFRRKINQTHADDNHNSSGGGGGGGDKKKYTTQSTKC